MFHDPICIPWITDIPLKISLRNKLLNDLKKVNEKQTARSIRKYQA